jgi:hypothetical protein
LPGPTSGFDRILLKKSKFEGSQNLAKADV